MGNATARAAFSLLRKSRISRDDYHQLAILDSAEAISEVAGKLYRGGQISSVEHDRLVRAGESDERARAMAKKKAKMAEIDRRMGGRRGCPVVQGGLPSLGKRR